MYMRICSRPCVGDALERATKNTASAGSYVFRLVHFTMLCVRLNARVNQFALHCARTGNMQTMV